MKTKFNMKTKWNIKNDIFTKVFIRYTSRSGWKIFSMSLYTILPVLFFALLPTFDVVKESPNRIFYVVFVSLTLSSIFSYASITRDLRESNILNKHIISRSNKIFIELVPIIFFILLNIVLFSINIGLVIFSFSLAKARLYYSSYLSDHTIDLIKENVANILNGIDWATLFFGAFCTILMAITIAKFIAVNLESKAGFILSRVVILVFIGLLSGASLFFGTNTLIDIKAFKIISYFSPFTYPFAIMNISISQGVPINAIFNFAAFNTPGVVIGTNFWNFSDPLAIVSTSLNGDIVIESLFYYKADKYLAFSLSITLPLILMYLSAHYLRPFSHLNNLYFIKNNGFTTTAPIENQIVKKIPTSFKKESK